MIANQFSFFSGDAFAANGEDAINRVSTAGERVEELGLIAIMTEGALLDDPTSYPSAHARQTLADSIQTFAKDIQNRLPHTKSLVIRVTPGETSVDISRALEKLYFEGDDAKSNNRLIGLIVVGDVPLPVVYDKEGSARVSVYPYVDFTDKRFIYNHATDRFEPGSPNPAQPEIWHGLMVPPKKGPAGRQPLADFFDKNHQYSIGDPAYSQFDERVLVADFTSELKQLNSLDYKNYLRTLKYLEETVYKRYNKHLLKQIAAEFSREMNPDTPPEEVPSLIDDEALRNLPDVATESMIQKYTGSLADGLKNYLGKLNRLVGVSGRWQSNQLDSPGSLITIRDLYTSQVLRTQNEALERAINVAIDTVATPYPVLSGVTLNVRVKECPNESSTEGCVNVIHSSQFPFDTYSAGKRVGNLTNVNQCGLMAGQPRPANQNDAILNNSVLVSANRLYNPNTAIIPNEEEEEDLEDLPEYREYGGCVGNNFLHPDKCHPDEATRDLFDILGAREVNLPFPDLQQCDVRLMSYKPRQTRGPLGLIFQNPFASEAAVLPGSFPFSVLSLSNVHKSLGQITDEAYNTALATQRIQPITVDPDLDYSDQELRIKKVSAVLSAIVPGNSTFTYSPQPGAVIELSVVPLPGSLPGTVKHNEPTDAHFRAIRGALFTPSLPADGIHFIEFNTSAGKKRFDYPNLFKVKGKSLAEASERFLDLVRDKNAELNQLLGRETNVIARYFLDHTEVLEPIQWLSLSADQKHAYILDKYLNPNAFFPASGTTAPKNRPQRGYQALYINAPEGDTHGFRYGVHGAMMKSVKDSEFDALKNPPPNDPTGTRRSGLGATPPGNTGPQNRAPTSVCGDASGVEIWEWFGAFQCWIREELLPASGLFSLDNSCSGAPIPVPSEDPNAGPLASASQALQNDRNDVPDRLKITMERPTLSAGDSVDIGVQVLNGNGEGVTGFMEGQVTVSLDNPALGTVTPKTFKPELGAGRVTLKALAAGEGKLRFTFGALKTEVPIRVVSALHLKLSATRNEEPTASTGAPKTSYAVTAQLLDDQNTPVTDVSSTVHFETLRYMDGGFDNNGIAEIRSGMAETVFYPSPMRPAIDLVATSPYFKSNTYRLTLPANAADHIVFAPRDFVWMNDRVTLPIRVTDVNGMTATGFSGNLEVKVTDVTKDLGVLRQTTVAIQNGAGEVDLDTFNLTGNLHLIAKAIPLPGADVDPRLRGAGTIKSGILEIPVRAGMTSDQMGRLPGNDLFATLIGFPAGDFTQEDYFGGAHLFQGKTEAVYSSIGGKPRTSLLTLDPNFYLTVTDTRLSIHPQVVQGEFLLQAFDDRSLREVWSGRRPFQFDSVEAWKEGVSIKPGTAYLESVGDGKIVTRDERRETRLVDREGNALVTLSKNDLILRDPNYHLVYVKDGDPRVTTLEVTSASTRIARIRLAFLEAALDPADFTVPAPLVLEKAPRGKSTHDLGALQLFDPTAPEATPENDSGNESFGWEKEHKHLLLFAGGSTAGDAVKYNLPVDGVLLGDPTIRLATRRSSNLDYDGTVGEKVYQDPKGATVKAMTSLDFNHDGEMDVAAIMNDGRVRLLEGGPTEPPLRDRGDLAFLADGAMALMSFDFKKDGYPELVVATAEGRLAILNNERGVLTRSNQKVKVGKKIYQILKADMDADGEEDLITLDSRGDIRIFYGDHGTIPENGILMGNYGMSLNRNANFAGDLQMRYAGIEGAGGAGAETRSIASLRGPVPGNLNAALGNVLNPDRPPAPIDPRKIQEMIAAQRNFGQSQGKNTPEEPATLPWREGDRSETVFAPVRSSNLITAEKHVQNKERPNASDLDLGETLVYTVTLRPRQNLNNFVLADSVPDSLSVDPQSVQCALCRDPKIQVNGTLLFVGNLNPGANQEIVITYEATVEHTPKANILLKRVDSPQDPYVDLAVSPPFNQTGQLIEHYSTGRRTYTTRATPPPAAGQNPIENQTKKMNDAARALSSVDTNDPNAVKAAVDQFGIGTIAQGLRDGTKSMSDKIGAEGVDTSQCTEGDLVCAERDVDRFLDGAIGAINDFACMGSACFPFPVNYAFLVPSVPPVPPIVPFFAFPATLPALIPIPVPSFFLAPSPFGAADIPGVFNSLLRIYLSPTLTGGVGVALCWGLYATSALPPPPPPLFPIPYPPPIGNCLVSALPMGGFPICKEIEHGITTAIQAANSVVSDINSGLASVNNNSYLGDQGGGGADESSLVVIPPLSLGTKNKFKVPTNIFTNKHLSSFDSIGGFMASWLDREWAEIKNKLLTLPNIQIALPDLPGLLVDEKDRFLKQLDQLGTVIQGNASGVAKTTGEVWADSTKDNPKDISDRLASGWNSLDQSINNFNPNVFEQLYDTLGAFPFVQIREVPVELKVPWISPREIHATILEWRSWIDFEKQEIDRVADKWASLVCETPDTSTNYDPAKGLGKSLSDKYGNDLEKIKDLCTAKKLGQIFIVDLQGTIDSIEKNIAVMESYLAFPRQFSKFNAQLADYLRQFGCDLEVWADLLGGWQAKLREQMIGYAEFVLTLNEIRKNIEKIIDIFVNFESNCTLCTNERFHWFGWITLLGLLIPEIPIIKFPKWPDILIDLSDFKAAVKVDVPRLNIIPEPVTLPQPPYIRLPDVPDLSIFLSLPRLPILPKLPTLPDLPPLPPIPTLKLPSLPPPPKIPNIGRTFGAIVPLVEKILQVWCLIRKSLSPVPESMLQDQISLLTTRPAYLIPLDFLKLSFPDIAVFDLGFNEVKVNVRSEIGVRIKGPFEEAQKAADKWNKTVTDIAGWADQQWQKSILKLRDELQKSLDDADRFMEEKIAALEESVQSGKILGDDAAKFLGDIQSELDGVQHDFDKATKGIQKTMNDATKALEESTAGAATKGIQGGVDSANRDAAQTGRDLSNDLNDALQGYNNAVRKVKNVIREGEQKIDNAIDLSPRPSTTPSGPQSFLPLQQTLTLAQQMAREIQKANDDLVDFHVVKEALGVPDMRFAARPTQADQVRLMRKNVIAMAERLDAENRNRGVAEDLRMLVAEGEGLDNHFKTDAVLAVGTVADANVGTGRDLSLRDTLMSSAVPVPAGADVPKRLAMANTNETSNAAADDSPVPPPPDAPCVGSCITDPVTRQMVTFVSYADDFGSMQTIFVPTGTAGKTNVVYSDDSSIYLKRNLTLPPDTNRNRAPTSFFSHVYPLSDFLPKGESTNLMDVSIQGNLASTFGWRESTDSRRYGTLIQVKKTIDGFDADQKDSPETDLSIVLLPPEESGELPKVLADGKPVSYSTLLLAEEEAGAAFPVKPLQTMTGVKKVEFKTMGRTITLSPKHAIYFDQYLANTYELHAENGFYHMKTSWFDRGGNGSTVNENEVLAPQIYGERSLPLTVLAKDTFLVPIFKRQAIRASDLFTDLTGAYQYTWDTNQDMLPDFTGPQFMLEPQKEPKEFNITLRASLDFSDEHFVPLEKKITVTVYVPPIDLLQEPIGKGEVSGILTPKEAWHDLSDIPFGVFRKRWGAWKNIGRSTTLPPQDATRSYRTMNEKGEYKITGFNTTDARVAVRDGQEKDLAYVLPGSGQIDLLDSRNYRLQPLPADDKHTTRIGIFSTDSPRLLSNVYYVADGNTDVTIRNEGLNSGNLESIGVTVGDRDMSDDLVAKNIPGFAPSFPGGVAIFAQGTTPEKVIAMISSSGAIRLLLPGYRLIFKNEGKLTEKPIFTITDPFGQPLFDVFIAADFRKPLIKQNETWGAGNVRVGAVGDAMNRVSTMGLITEAHAAEPVPSPFQDVSPEHPQFKAIKNLYEKRVVSGYGDGTFRPDATISRAEFVKIALGATNCFDCTQPTEPLRARYSVALPFPDVASKAWYYFCLWIAKELRMITGYGDGLFRPEQNISRAEAAAVLLRQSGIELTATPNQEFIDVPAHAWYKDYVYMAVQIGLIKNNLGFVFPDQEITRGEFAFMADSVMNLKDCREVDSDKDTLPDRWEMDHGLDFLSGSDAQSDRDADNLTAAEEFRKGTDPHNSDSDGDGLRDDLDPQPAPPSSATAETGASTANQGQRNEGAGANEAQTRANLNTDIDNDGVPNAPGIFGSDGLINPEALRASRDNCVFVSNPDQRDGDENGIGDACEEHDLCPTLPENRNGIDDTDGCPEVTDHLPTNPPGTYVNHGPDCFFLDYMADLLPGDTLFTAITDLVTHTTVFSKSAEAEIK